VMDKDNFRLRLKEPTSDMNSHSDHGVIVYKRKRSGDYIPTLEPKYKFKKDLNDIFPYFDSVPDEICLRIYYFFERKRIMPGPKPSL